MGGNTMTIYTYETSNDEETALDLLLLQENGKRVGSGQPMVDKQGLITQKVHDVLSGPTQQMLLSRLNSVVEQFIKGDEAFRTQLLDATSAVIKVKP
jgi:hypothetical protein